MLWACKSNVGAYSMKNSRREAPRPHSYTHTPPGQTPTPQHIGEQRVLPQPIGDKCNPLCPLFICSRNALFVINKPFKGRVLRSAQCRLTGGECIGGECQYSSCRVNSLLPNNKCVKALERRLSRQSDEELFRQMMQLEEYDVDYFKR